MAGVYVPGLVMTKEEKIVYGYIYAMADYKRIGKVDAGTVHKMFMMAQPPIQRQNLALIWELSNQNRTQGALKKEDFYRALRYIAIAQAQRPVSKASLSQSNSHRVALPVLAGFNVQQIIANHGKSPKVKVAARTQPVAGSYTAAGQSSQAAYAAAPGPQPQATVSNQNPTAVPRPLPGSEGGKVWEMSASEKASYQTYFQTADRDRDGFVSGKEAQDFFRMSQLSSAVLRHIWILSDVDQDNKLDFREFAIAMHIIMKVRSRAAQVPKKLPPELIAIVKPQPAVATNPEAQSAEDDPIGEFIQPNGAGMLNRQPSKLAMADPSTVVPLESSIRAQQTQRDNFDEDLKLNNEKLTQTLAEVAELKSKLESLVTETEEIKTKIKDGQEELKHYEEQKGELLSQVEDREETVDHHKETLAILEAKLDVARKAYNEKSQRLMEQNNDMSRVKQTTSQMEGEIERLRREGEGLDSKMARHEKLLENARLRQKECEERKVAQEQIIKEKKEHLARLQGRTSESKSLIGKAKAELEALKLESRRLRAEIKASAAGGGGFNFVESKGEIDSKILQEKQTIQSLQNTLNSVKAGDAAAISTDDGFGDDPFSPQKAPEATAAVGSDPDSTGGEAFPDMTFPTFDMDAENPFDANPFTDNAPATDPAPATDNPNDNGTNADLTDPSMDNLARFPTADVVAGDEFGLDPGAPATVDTKADTKGAADPLDFDFGGVENTGAAPAPVAAPAANMNDKDPFDADADPFGENAAATPATESKPAAATDDDDPFGDAFAAVPTAAASKPAETVATAAADDFGGDDFDFGGAVADTKKSQPPKKATSSNGPSDGFGFDDDGDIFGTAAPPKAEKKEEKKGHQNAPTAADFDAGFDDDDGFGLPSMSNTKTKPKPAPVAASKPDAAGAGDEENPFDAPDPFGGGGGVDEDNPFDSGGAPATGPKTAAASKPANFDAGFDDDDFKFD